MIHCARRVTEHGVGGAATTVAVVLCSAAAADAGSLQSRDVGQRPTSCSVP